VKPLFFLSNQLVLVDRTRYDLEKGSGGFFGPVQTIRKILPTPFGDQGVTMHVRRIAQALAILFAVCTLAPRVSSAADDGLTHAKALYAAASYDEALSELDKLKTSAAPEDATTIEVYRVFCLLALDRRDEARTAIDRIFHENPGYMPPSDVASPRVQSIFHDVRRQSLPRIVMERYTSAKSSFDKKDPRAGQQFDDLIKLLDDPDLEEGSALNDLRAVASAFRDLTKAMAAAGPTITNPEGKPVQSSAAAPKTPEPPADIIYTAADADVIAPVVKSQKLPTWRPKSNEMNQDIRGVLRVLIDREGSVVSASMFAGTLPAYDQALVKAAKDWKFQPARKGNVPVQYLKLIEIRLKPGTS